MFSKIMPCVSTAMLSDKKKIKNERIYISNYNQFVNKIVIINEIRVENLL